MSAPITERARAGAGTAIPAQRGRRGGAKAGQAGSQRTARNPRRAGWGDQAGSPGATAQRSTGTQKAYARREERLRRVAGGAPARSAGTGRAQFVLLVMGLLLTGLVATLWLSTAAAADSYRLQDARVAARELSAQSERLHREVASMESAPELARRASALGMVPVQDPARLVVRPDGSVTVVGVPMPATAKAPPVPAAPPPAAGPAPADATSQTPADQESAVPAAGAPATGADADQGTGAAAASTGTGQEGAGEDGNGAGTAGAAGGAAAGNAPAIGDAATTGDTASGSAASEGAAASGRTAGTGRDANAGGTADRSGAAPTTGSGRGRTESGAG